MSREITQIELTSKPLKLALALTGSAFLVSLLGMVYSFGEPDMSTVHWFVGLLVTFAIHQVCRAVRWWEHG
jgi:cytosine/uracil/thiamine/allantoin permease